MMVESCICCGIQPITVPSTSWPRMSRDGALSLPNVHRGGPPLGLSFSALQLGRKFSSHGVVGNSNFAPRGVSQVHTHEGGRALGYGSSLAIVRKPSLSLRLMKVGNKLENDREEAVSSPPKKEDKEKSVDKKEGLVESIEAELGRQFGGVLWFSVLLLALAFFGGVYVFLIVNYADFSDIPIFRGPQR
ncbi:unnamed protein product [Calypogeia fissa]